MELLNDLEKNILLMINLLSLIIIIFNVFLLFQNQKKVPFLHPGWLLNLLLIFYGFTTPLYLSFASNDVSKLNTYFVSVFTYDSFLKIFLLYILILITYTFCEIGIYYYLKDKKRIIVTKKSIINGWEKQSYKLTFFLLVTVLALVIFQNLYVLGGFSASEILNKNLRYETVFGIPYTPLYQAIYLFWFHYLIKFDSKKIRYNFFYLTTYLIFTLFIIFMGTNLQILLVIIGKIFILFAYNKEYLFKNWKPITFILIILASIFISVQNYRELKVHDTQSFNMSDILKIPNLTDFETITGYIPGLIILNDEHITHEYSFGDFITEGLPNSLITAVGVDKGNSLTKLVHDSHLINNTGMYTVTLPVNLYAGVGLVGMVLLSIFVYLLIFIAIYSCFKMGNKFIYIATIIFCTLFYLIRVGLNSWLGKIRLDLSNSILVLLISYLVYLMFKSYIYKTRGYLSSRKEIG